ncbi:MAG: hypothetical protein V5A23_00685 [Halobacteriales archaeon]
MANARYDEAALAKYGFVAGVAMIVAGALGHSTLPVLVGPLPGWESALLTDLEVLGVLVGVFSVFGFGIFLPLTR